MSNESTLAVAEVPAMPATIVEASLPEQHVDVVGENPKEIWQGQQRLIDWCVAKVEQEKRDHTELQAAFELAKTRKWKSATLAAHANKARHRVIYYEKMLAAFRAGFVMVPNFQMSVFAIRTGKGPDLIISTNRAYAAKYREAGTLKISAGDYQNPSPTTLDVDYDEKEDKTVWASEKWDNLDFPIDMAKVEVMEAVDHAMALKIFDEIGILPARRTKGDPVISGRIRMGGVQKWSAKEAQFLIAWRVDTRTL